MKKQSILAFILVAVLLALSLASCSAGESDYDGGGGVGGYTPIYKRSADVDGIEGLEVYDIKTSEEGGVIVDEEGKSSETAENQTRAGTITASAWDDNIYYNYFLELFEGEITEKISDGEKVIQEEGRFYEYAQNLRGFYSFNRVKVTVKNGENVVVGAKVEADDYKAVTNSNGVAYLFPKAESGKITITCGSEVTEANYTADNHDIEVSVSSTCEKKQVIQIMIVLDVTGSMGDEIDYLKEELGDVINQIATKFDNISVQLGFVFYRDDDDDVKLKAVDFYDVTEQSSYNVIAKELEKQNADGGGDYPEASDEALELAMTKQWIDGATKILFHIYDAPAHDTGTKMSRYSEAVRTASEKGIRICPIIASGADTLCEYLARQSAIMTGGTFCYITDDSGVGDGHYDPDIPNAVVERMNDMMVRLVVGYYTGTFPKAVDYKTANAQ